MPITLNKIELERFDAQMLDVIAGWIELYRCGRSVHGAMADMRLLLPAPAEAQFRQLEDDIMSGTHLSEALQNMVQRVSSENLRLIVEAFDTHWKDGTGSYQLCEHLKAISQRLWKKHTPKMQPIVTDRDEIYTLLSDYSYSEDDNIRQGAKSQLLTLGDHLAIYIVVAIWGGHAHTEIAAFSLLKALNTPTAIKNLKRYAESGITNHNKRIARAVLDDLGIPYSPQPPQKLRATIVYCRLCMEKIETFDYETCWLCGGNICKNHQVFRSISDERAVFCSEDHWQHAERALKFW